MTEMRLNERYLAAIVQSSEDAIIGKDIDGIITIWNVGAEHLYGYTSEEVLGKPITIIMPPEHIDELPLIMNKIRNGELIEHYETIRQRKDGTRFLVLLTISPIRDLDGTVIGASAIARDIADYKRVEAALRQSEEQFRRLVETAPGAILLVNAAGLIIRTNERVEELFGYIRNELIGQSVEILLPEQFRSAHAYHRVKYVAQPGVRMMGIGRDLLGRRKDGSEFPVEIGLSYINSPDGIVIVAFVTDITERQHAEEERLGLAIREQAALVEVERSKYEERERIAMELHDGIIQSIYAVGMGLEIARTSLVKDEELNRILTGTAHDLDNVINDLRRYIRDLKVGINHSVEFKQRIDEITRKFRETCPANLIIDIPETINFPSEDHMHATVQIVRESLSNIARHARATEVWLTLTASSAKSVLSISDNGIGFNLNNVNLGRGLENIRQRVQRLNGTLDIVSRPTQGTTLTIIFSPTLETE